MSSSATTGGAFRPPYPPSPPPLSFNRPRGCSQAALFPEACPGTHLPPCSWGSLLNQGRGGRSQRPWLRPAIGETHPPTPQHPRLLAAVAVVSAIGGQQPCRSILRCNAGVRSLWRRERRRWPSAPHSTPCWPEPAATAAVTRVAACTYHLFFKKYAHGAVPGREYLWQENS